jgi:hypothetical protein
MGCKNGTQLAYQQAIMRSILTLAALGGLALGLRHFFIFLNEQEKNRIQEKRLEIWEGEGGAVPVAATRTAAQVRPQKPSGASSSGVN